MGAVISFPSSHAHSGCKIKFAHRASETNDPCGNTTKQLFYVEYIYVFVSELSYFGTDVTRLGLTAAKRLQALGATLDVSFFPQPFAQRIQ